MKRSEINFEIQEAEKFFRLHHFTLPCYANWTCNDWLLHHDRCAEIVSCCLGWDLTDFGKGSFRQEGLLLFTLRNGLPGSPVYSKPYAEKIMIVRENQKTLLHTHICKTEDIINRGGGDLCFQLFGSTAEKELDMETPVSFSQDGLQRKVFPGEKFILRPGESLTLIPGIFHSFWAVPGTGDVLTGEVSAVNDDRNDNIYHGEQLRFPKIEEDVPPYRLLVADYKNM